MLLVEQSVAAKLNQGNSFKDKSILGPKDNIDHQTFLRLKGNFIGKMITYGHQDDYNIQYFQRGSFDFIDNTLIKKIAFIFLSKPKGQNERLSVGMVGLSANGDLIYPEKFGYVSVRNRPTGGAPQRIPQQLFEKLSANYVDRIGPNEDKLDFYPCRDKGIVHEKSIIIEWRNSVTDYAEVHFGIQSNDLQNIMLVSDQSLASGPPQPNTMYAFDQGNGCCPK